jgi:predicted dehydrogenase
MVVFDDMESDRKVTIYDKGITQPRADTYGEYVGVRMGDISIPRVASDEPLRLEVEEFAAAIREQRTPLSDGHSGIAVVEVLEGLQRSLDDGGRVITIDPSLA